MLRNLPGRGNLLRVRAQCLARETLVRLEVPKRTHLIRMLLDEGAVLDDGLFRPACAPHRLSDDSAGLDQAEAIIRGAAVSSLPVVYLSALECGGWALRRDEVARLATDLGGVAQVVWDRLHGLIAAYRQGEDVLVRAYFEKHCLPQAQLLRDLLEVYRAEIGDERLQKEVDWVRFALESFGGAR